MNWRGAAKYWKPLTALTSAISSIVLGFTNLFKLPLDARFVLVGAIALVGVTVFCLWLSTPAKAQTRPKASRVALRCLALLFLCWAAVRALEVTAAYHNVRVFRRICSQCPNVGTIEIQPPRFPVQLTVNVWVPQTRGVRIERFFPASWNRQDTVNWQERNRTEFQDTFILAGFKRPKVFGIWYQLNASADVFDWEVIPAPDNIRVLTEARLRWYRNWFYVCGGVVWLIGVCFFFLRWFWFHKRRA